MNKASEFVKQMKWHLQEGYVKVNVIGKDGTSEWLWCTPVDTNLLKVANVPFFVGGVCLDDVIEVTPMKGCPGRYSLKKVVEHVREGRCFKYDVPEDRAELQKRFSAFCKACNEIDAKAEGMIAGYLVIALPWGTSEAKMPAIMECAFKAGLTGLVLCEA